MKPNRFITFGIEGIRDVSEVVDIPRGTLFEVALNPWNGNVVFSFQDSPDARFLSRIVIGQLAENFELFEEDSYPCAARSDLLPMWRDGNEPSHPSELPRESVFAPKCSVRY